MVTRGLGSVEGNSDIATGVGVGITAEGVGNF